jgi:RNA polymerase sigma factor (sigma-70 family)
MRLTYIQAPVFRVERPMSKPAAKLDQLNARYRPALLAFFARRLRNSTEAEDLTQEVFVRLANARDREIENSDAYIFQIAANILRDRSRRERVRSDFRSELGYLESTAVETLDPDRFLESRETLAEIIAALHELPERTRSIFMLVRLENLKQAEIAAHYGISVSAVEKHLGKAVLRLARCIR